jgi:hypothetical protein
MSKKNRQHNGQKKKYKRTRRVWRYQRGNQNPYIEEQTTQLPTEKVQKDKKSLWPLCCLFFFDIRILITPLVSSNSSCPFVIFLLVIVLSVLLRHTDSDCPFGIFKLF